MPPKPSDDGWFFWPMYLAWNLQADLFTYKLHAAIVWISTYARGYKTRWVSQKNTCQALLIELSLLSKERKSHQIHILGGTDNMKHDTAPN